MAEKGYKYKVIRELNFIANDDSFSDMERSYASQLGDKLVDKNDEEIKKILYASFNDPKLYNITKAIASAMPKDTEIEKVTRATTQAPKYRTEIGAMFAKFGGDEILDERSPKFWANADSEITDKVVADIAEANGMPKKEVYDMLQEESIKERDRQIFSGTDIGATTGDRLTALGLKFFAPRTMESIEQGKGIVPADVATDVAENIVYGINPIGKAGQLGVRAFGRFAPRLATETAKSVGKAGVGVASAFGTPALMEATDKIVQESIDSDNVKSSEEIKANIVDEGTANLLMGKYGLRNIGKFAGKERSAVRRLLTGEAEKKKPEEVKKTWKEFKSETEKALKESEKVAKGVGGEEAKMAMTPKQRVAYEKSTPIFSGDAELDETATEIAKIVGSKGVSLDKATEIYFKKLAEKKGTPFVEQKLERFNDRKNPVFIVGEGGKVYPQRELMKMIQQSSWGDVLTTEFAKTKRAKPVRESFIRKHLMGGTDIEPREYAKFKIADVAKEQLPNISLIDDAEGKKRREDERKAEIESKARSKYVFNPYATEEEKPKKRGGIRAYLRGESEVPSEEELERMTAEQLGIKLVE